MSQQSITLIRNEGVLPLSMKAGDKVLLISAYDNELTAMKWATRRLVDEGAIESVEISTYCYGNKDGIDDDLANMINEADGAVLVSEISAAFRLEAGQWYSDMPLIILDALNERGVPATVMSIYLPADVALYDEAKAILCCYNPTGMPNSATDDPSIAYGPGIPAAMDVIFGVAEAGGKLPVPVYEIDARRRITDTMAYPVGYSWE
ncbi:MAG: hypothetical protein Q4D04_06575 [Clostridia bacterium]|nr:hypothetical protein [Clostridia bacterium]